MKYLTIAAVMVFAAAAFVILGNDPSPDKGSPSAQAQPRPSQSNGPSDAISQMVK